MNSELETENSLQWSRRFLPHYFSDEPAAFHVELMAALESDRRLIAQVAPRGHAKSTCTALAYPLWCICEQRRRNIVIITHEESLARQFVRDIRQELESNEALIERYGDLCCGVGVPPAQARGRAGCARLPADPPRATVERKAGTARPTARPKRSDRMFITNTGITIQARGVGGSFRGTRTGPHRPDLVICDDIEKDTLVRSAENRRKTEAWLQRVVLPALAPHGQLVVIGSILHHDSLLARLADRTKWPRWDYAVYRALEVIPQLDGTFIRQALWPARWPVERLDLERERIGTIAFNQEYQAQPADDAGRVFRPEWLKTYGPSELVPERLVTLMAVDPATGKSAGDFFALWIGSVDTTTGIIYSRELSLERIGAPEQLKRIIAAFERWRPAKVGIETNGYQFALKQLLDDESRKRGLYMPVVAMNTSTGKEARIQGSSALYENGTFRLPPALSPEAEAQFLQFPNGGHDDAPDVCMMGIELARTVTRDRRVEALVSRFASNRREGW